MKISTKLEQAINDQIRLELESEMAYLAICAWFETTPFKGFTKWMRIQSAEEHIHAMKFFDYLNTRFGVVKLQALPKPSVDLKKPLDGFKVSLAHEQKVTASINSLYSLAREEKDYQTQDFLGWFLEEQIEEEKSVQDMIDRLELVGDNAHALLLIDQEAGNAKTMPASTVEAA